MQIVDIIATIGGVIVTEVSVIGPTQTFTSATPIATTMETILGLNFVSKIVVETIWKSLCLLIDATF